MTDAEKLRGAALTLRNYGCTGRASDVEAIATKLDRLYDREWVGRMMHESWSEVKRNHGFHGPIEHCMVCQDYPDDSGPDVYTCRNIHADLISWDDLPEAQKDINRHALDRVLTALEQP